MRTRVHLRMDAPVSMISVKFFSNSLGVPIRLGMTQWIMV